MNAQLPSYCSQDEEDVFALARLLKNECLCGWETDGSTKSRKLRNKPNKKTRSAKDGTLRQNTKKTRCNSKDKFLRSKQSFKEKGGKSEDSFVHHKDPKQYIEEYRKRKLLAMVEKHNQETMSAHQSDIDFIEKQNFIDNCDDKIAETAQCFPATATKQTYISGDDHYSSFAYRFPSAPATVKVSCKDFKSEKKSENVLAVRGGGILDHPEDGHGNSAEAKLPVRKELSICHLSAYGESSCKGSNRPLELLEVAPLLQCKKIDNRIPQEIPREKKCNPVLSQTKAQLTVKNIEVLTISSAIEMKKVSHTTKNISSKDYCHIIKRALGQYTRDKSLQSIPKTDLNSVFS